MSSWFRWGRGSSGAAKGAPAAEKKKEGEAKSEVISFESIPGTFRDPDLELLIEEVRQLPVIDKCVSFFALFFVLFVVFSCHFHMIILPFNARLCLFASPCASMPPCSCACPLSLPSRKVLNQLFHTGLAFDKSLPTDALSHADQEYPLFMSKAHAHLVSGDLKELSNVAHYFKNFMCLFGAVRVSQFCLNVHHYCVLLDYTGKKEIAKESGASSEMGNRHVWCRGLKLSCCVK